MRYLLIVLLLFFGCDEDPVSPIHGCFDSQACNYNPSASIDNNSCVYAEENYDCDGNCTAIVDECGECGGDNSSCEDCAGTPNGSAVVDGCGVCEGDNSNEDGYHCVDMQVLQDFIDLNESLTGQNPLDIGSQDWVDGSLTYLSLQSNQLTSIPESIGELNNLEYLYLSFNQLTSLPESIGDLSNLEYLYLSQNQLTSLPENIGNLSSLNELYLFYNQLTSLPESICNLPSNCLIYVTNNELCEEYHYDCIYNWGTQDQSNCQ